MSAEIPPQYFWDLFQKMNQKSITNSSESKINAVTKLHNLLACLPAKAGYQRFVTAYCLLYYCLLTYHCLAWCG